MKIKSGKIPFEAISFGCCFFRIPCGCRNFGIQIWRWQLVFIWGKCTGTDQEVTEYSDGEHKMTALGKVEP